MIPQLIDYEAAIARRIKASFNRYQCPEGGYRRLDRIYIQKRSTDSLEEREQSPDLVASPGGRACR